MTINIPTREHELESYGMLALNGYIRRVVETVDGAGIWDDTNGKKLETFAASENAAALYIAKITDGEEGANFKILDSLEAFPEGIATLLAVMKRPGVLMDGENLASMVSVVEVPMGANVSTYETLTSMIRSVVGPIFEASATEKTQKSSNYTTARQKLAELELSLVNLQHHQEVEFVELDIPTVSGNTDTETLNSLQNVVNGWKRTAQSVAATDRDIASGSTSEEVHFWQSMETALTHLQSQLETDDVKAVLSVLEQGKRFHATVNFLSNTGLPDALDKIQKYNTLLRDLPLNDLLTASSVNAIPSALDAIFTHISKRLRASNYPVWRCLMLVEAISGDLVTVLRQTTGYLLGIPLVDFQMRTTALRKVFSTWDDHVRDFTTLARDVIRKRGEKFIPVRIKSRHALLKERIEYIEAFRQRHGELTSTLEEVSKNDRELRSLDLAGKLEKAYEKLAAVDVLENSTASTAEWAVAEKEYDSAAAQAESDVAQVLRARLGASSSAQDMFGVFDQFNALFGRPAIRGAIQEYQAVLLERVKADISELQKRASRKEALTAAASSGKLRDIPRLAGLVSWMSQVVARLDTLLARVGSVLGPEWRYYADGERLYTDCETFRAQFDPKRVVNEWVTSLSSLKLAGPVLVAKRGRLSVNLDRQLWNLHREIKMLRTLRLPVPHQVLALSSDVLVVYPTAVRLNECIKTFYIVDELKSPVRYLVTSYFNATYELFEELINLQWQDFLGIDERPTSLAAKLDRAVSQLEAQAYQAQASHARVTQLISDLESCEYNKEEFARILSAISQEIIGAPDSYVEEVEKMSNAVLEQRSREAIKTLMANMPPQHHRISLVDQTVNVSPTLEDTLQTWYSKLREIINVTGNDADIEAIGEAISEILSNYRAASSYLSQWLDFQSLWDLKPGRVFEELKSDIKVWLQALEEIRQARTDLERGGGERKFGTFIVNFSQVYWIISSKYDMWQNNLTQRFGELVAEWSELFATSLKTPRVALESLVISDTHPEAVSRSINTIKLAKEAIGDNASSKLSCLRKSQVLLARHRFNFPSNWVYTEQLNDDWTDLHTLLIARESEFASTRDLLRTGTQDELQRLNRHVTELLSQWASGKPISGSTKPEDALYALSKFDDSVKKYSHTRDLVYQACEEFDVMFDVPSLDDVAEEISDFITVWKAINSAWGELRSLENTSWDTVKSRAVRSTLKSLVEQTQEMPARVRQYAAFQHLQNVLRQRIETSDLIQRLLSPSMQPRHWRELGSVPSVLGDVWDLDLFVNRNKVEELLEAVEGEARLSDYISEVADFWSKFKLQLVPLRQMKLIKNWSEIFNHIDEHLQSLATMHHSPHFAAVVSACNEWELKLAGLKALFDTWIEVQRDWVYMDGVFNAPELRQVLPIETTKFNSVNAELFAILRLVMRSDRILDVAAIPGIHESIARLSEQLRKIQRALGEYFERERQRFPRFYFVGDDDLLEMIGTPHSCERHLSKMFAGISSFLRNNAQIVGVVSPQGEELMFAESVSGDSAASILQELEQKSMAALQRATREAYDTIDWMNLAAWLEKFPSQATLLAMQLSEPPAYDAVLSQLAEIAGKSQSMSTLARRKLEAAITLLVHLQKSGRQLMYRWGDADTVSVTFYGATFDYGFEYQGVPDALVRTELGDELFLTLTQALAQKQGGAPFGPAGTGKTESVKALGQALGKYVLVFCCDETFDVRAVSRLLLGICQVGAWGCFDEFNRLNTTDLSAVSSQVAEIESSLAHGRESIELGGRRGALSPQTGLFVTMNPNYAGRNALPENLRKQFRSFALTHPDKKRIAEVMLYAQGFTQAGSIASAIVPLFENIARNLSVQRHYDWGLRALKNVLRICGVLKTVEPTELAAVRRACAETLAPKLVSQDLEIYNALEQEAFGGDKPKLSVLDISEAARKLNLTPSDELALKVTQLKRFLELHIGVILVGPPASGKTSSLRCLSKVLNAEIYTIDAKVISKSELYGRLDPVTREWTDGLFTYLLRRVINNLRGEDRNEHWVVFDGDVDPEWAENLNSVLDDNKILTLPSGERLQVPSNFRILFEVADLAAATPATVSRCGIIWHGERNELDTTGVASQAMKLNHIMAFSSIQAEKSYNAMYNVLSEKSDVPEYLEKAKILALTWAFAGQCSSMERADFANWVAAKYGVNTPENVLEYEVSPFSGQWVSLQDSVDEVDLEPSSIVEPNLVIPTIDTVRLEKLLLQLLTSHQPVILCGPPGSGKTMTLLSCLRGSELMDVVPLNFSKTTRTSQIISTLEQHCVYSNTPDGMVLEPAVIGRWVVLFCDEINLVARDPFGTQAPIALLRQLTEHGGFWRGHQWVSLRRIQYVGACNPPTDAGRIPLSPRFLRHCTIINVDYPTLPSLKQIYGAFSSAVLKCVPELRGTATGLSDAMLEIYVNCAESPFSKNYVYSPRELTRWVRGIYHAITDQYDLSLDEFARVWAYEGLRVFSDRLRTNEERDWTVEKITQVAKTHFGTSDLALPLLFNRWLSRKSQNSNRKALTEFLQARMTVFAEEIIDMPLTLFDESVEHALHIDRVLRQAQGHLILVGASASGKTTLVRFVCWMDGIITYQLKTFNGYGEAEFSSDLRTVLRNAVAAPICLLLDESQLKDSAFIEKMNTLLANGEVPGLFEGDEMASLLSVCRSSGATGDDEDVLRWFTARITLHLHVVFTVGASSSLLASPALANRCVLNFMGDWSQPSLLQVAEARTFLYDVARETPSAMVSIHGIASQHLQVSPGHFIAFINLFCKLYAMKKGELEEDQRHFNVGIDRLKGTMLEVRKMRTRLASKQEELAVKQKSAKQMLQRMLAEQSEAERKREASIEIRAAVEEQNKVIQEQQEQVYADLQRAEPAVRDALQGVSSIKKQHLNELRAFTNPPEAVKITLEAVCVLLGRTPSSWREVLQHVRSDDFIANIVRFDNERQVTPQILRQLQKYLDLPNFNYEAVNRASKACGPLLQWVLAQVAYATVLQRVEPLRRQVTELEKAAREKQAQEVAINEMIDELERSIGQYETDYAALIAEAQAVKQDMEAVDSRISRSVDLIASLDSEKTRWGESVKQFTAVRQRLLGDCLVSAAFAAYAGALDQRRRIELVDEWLLVCEGNSIAFTEGIDIATYLTGKPSFGDALTVANAAILARCDQYAYVVDPTGERALQIIRDQHPQVVVTSFNDAAFQKHVESALRFGTAVVITNAESFDPLVMPIINKEYTRRGGRVLVEFANNEVDVSPKFTLFLLTSDAQISPPEHLSARTTMVNFNVTRNSLELIALEKSLDSHRPELQKKRTELVKARTEYQVKLHGYEVQLLESLNDAGEEILDNQPVMDTLERVKKQAEYVTSQINEAEAAMEAVAAATAEFEPVALHSGRLFSLIDELKAVHHFYQFPLEFFLDVLAKIQPTAETISELYHEVYRQVGPALRQVDRPALAALLLSLFTDSEVGVAELESNTDLGTFERLSAETSWLEAIKKATRPVLFGMSGADPTLQVCRLAEACQVDCVVISLGSIQSTSILDNAIQRAASQGQWLLLQNVHLDAKATSLVLNLPAAPHSSFRLLMTSNISSTLAAPFLRRCHLLCVERPETVTIGVSEALAFAGKGISQPPAERAKIYLSVCWLHAIVVERWADQYSFSDADLQAALWTVDQWVPKTTRSNVDPASLPWDILRDLIFSAVYAAKMDGADDREGLRALVDKHLTVELFEVGFRFCDDVQVPEYDNQLSEWVSGLPAKHRPSWLGLSEEVQDKRNEDNYAVTVATAEALRRNLGI